jgi:mRNA-degrading endonuclease RelE of RelBE toxin-antitoxin system
MSYEVIAAESFKRSYKKLRKTYKRMDEDFASLLDVLEDNPSEGEAIPGFSNKIYKVRMKSADMKRGKRGGFRVIYYLTDHIVYLLTIYAKAKRETISANEIKTALKEMDMVL